MANQFNKDDMQQFRSTANNYGYENLNWDGKNVTATKNGNSYLFKTDGLTNVNGRLYGTKEQLNDIFSNPLSQVRNTAVSQGVNVGYNQYNQPVLNGQAVATNGMVNSGGNWYMEGGALNDLLSGVAYKEYENPYQDNLVDYLDQLVNYKEFSYDAESDENLQDAMGFARRQAMRNAVERGQGNSYGMEYAASTAANNLIPQYEQKAYDRYINERNYLTDLLNITRGLSQDSFNEYNALETLDETRRQNDAQMDYNNRLLANEDRNYDRSVFESDREFGHKEWYDKASLAQAAEQFAKNLDLSERQWTSQDALAWAEHTLNGMKFVSDQEARKAEIAMQNWLASGVADEEIARVLGVPVGTKTIDMMNLDLQYGKFDYQKQKSNNNNNNNNPKNSGNPTSVADKKAALFG